MDKKVINEENLDIKRKKRKSDIKKDAYSSQSNISLYQKDNKSLILNLDNNNNREVSKNNSNNINIYNDNKIYKKSFTKIEQYYKTDKNKNKKLIKKIKINKFCIYCSFYCVRNISNIKNFLLDEGMKLIMEQLDVFNLFLQLYKNARKEQQLKENEFILEMSSECKKNLLKIKNKFSNFSFHSHI